MTKQHGSSGAIIVSDGYDPIVTKRGTGDGRTAAQGEWLARCSSSVLVDVYSVDEDDDSYAMPELVPLPRSLVSSAEVATWIITALNEHLWTSSQELVAFDLDAHVDKLMATAAKVPDVNASRLFETAYKIQWDKLRPVKTHGDPTLDNVMLGIDGVPLLIDPIPATPAVPDLMCVDLGKILQSSSGFEAARYGMREGGFKKAFAVEAEVLGYLDTYRTQGNRFIEIHAAHYWRAVHLLRALPYMPEEVRADVQQLFAGAVDRL